MEVNELRSWTIVWALVVSSCALALNSQPACWLYFLDALAPRRDCSRGTFFYFHFYSLLIIRLILTFVICKLQTWNCALWRVKFLNYTASLRTKFIAGKMASFSLQRDFLSQLRYKVTTFSGRVVFLWPTLAFIVIYWLKLSEILLHKSLNFRTFVV